MKRFEVVEINSETDFCECCGKTGLKRVVWIHDIKNDDTKHFGTTCAMQPAKGFDLTSEIKDEIKKHDLLQSLRLKSAIAQYKADGGQYISNANGSWSVADKEHMRLCLQAWERRMFNAAGEPIPVFEPVTTEPRVAVAVFVVQPAAPALSEEQRAAIEKRKQMNRERRKQLEAIRTALEDAKNAIETAKGELEDVKNEEDEARENSAVKQGEKFEASEQASENMESADEQIDSVIEALDTAISGLEDAEGSVEQAAA